MSSAALVVVCALSILGRSAKTLPAISFVDVPPPGVSRLAEGFAHHDPEVIYLVTSSEVFRSALAAASRTGRPCAGYVPLAKVASIIVHEEWHLRYGADERTAYDAQIMLLRSRLGFAADSPIVQGVRAAMRAALRTPSTPTRPGTLVASTDE